MNNKNYFKTEITNLIGTKFKESYSVGICGDNWNIQDAKEFLKVWTDAFKEIAEDEDFNCIRKIKEPEMCTKNQYEDCWIKIEDFQIR